MVVFFQDKIVLGSDYPFPLGEHRAGELIESVEEYSVDLKVIYFIFFNYKFCVKFLFLKEKLLYRNAMEFLGLN